MAALKVGDGLCEKTGGGGEAQGGEGFGIWGDCGLVCDGPWMPCWLSVFVAEKG